MEVKRGRLFWFEIVTAAANNQRLIDDVVLLLSGLFNSSVSFILPALTGKKRALCQPIIAHSVA